MAAAVLFFVLFQHPILRNKASEVPRVRHLKWKRIFCPLSAENTPNKPKNRAREGKNQFHPFGCNFMDCVGL
jgi:hypothetical protein